jgi:hypothetical protein
LANRLFDAKTPELPMGQTLRVGPNPARDHAKVLYRVGMNTRVRLQVFNVAGESVWQEELGQRPVGTGETALDLSRFASGAYFVLLEVDQGGGLAPVGTFKLAVLK